MKTKITFKMWLSVFFGGIWQFIRNIFSWKNKTPFWRVIWATITLCILAFTCMLGYAFYDEFYGRRHSPWYYDGATLGGEYSYRNCGYNTGKSYIYDRRNEKKVLKDIDWIAKSFDGDSLAVISKDGKRGYINRYTAEIEIPLQYDAAWIFSENVAGVCAGDSVFFIDQTGKPINSKKYPREKSFNDYIYHGEYAPIPENGIVGLVDKTGDWVVKPEYDKITATEKNMWIAQVDDKYGVLSNEGVLIIPCEYPDVRVNSGNGITVTLADNSKKRFDYDGSLLDGFMADNVYMLEYYIDEYNNEGNRITKYANIYRYEVGDFVGLMDLDGKPITPPIYWSIECISPNIFNCYIPNAGASILLDRKGNKIND